MLARVLLTLHNLHHYQAFFVALQSAIRLRLIMSEYRKASYILNARDGKLDDLRRVVIRGYHHPAG